MSYKRISPIPVIEGGTGAITLTNHGVLVGAATSAITQLAVGATGTVLIGNTGADPSFSATPTVTSITINNAPVASTDGTNKAYVDAIASGINFLDAVYAATTPASSLSVTYSNGVAGVGATLTNAGSQAAFAIDGVTPPITSRVLIKDFTGGNSYQNGIYNVTVVGTGITNWVLTRALNYNTPAQINPGDLFPVTNGTVNAGTSWIETATVTAIGSGNPITFAQFSYGPSTFLQVANNLSDVASASTSRTNLGLTAVATQTVTQYNALIGGAANAITSVAPSATAGVPLISGGSTANPSFGTAVVAGGGTGNTTFTAYSVITAGTTATGAFQNVSGLGSSGNVLTSNGAGALPTWQAAAASSISITGNTGGALTGAAFTFSGGTTGLSFGGSGSTETLTFAGITANAGVVNLGSDATDNTINIGTAASSGRTINIGNVTGASGIVERVGTGNWSLDGATGSTYTLGASTTTGTITIGGTAQTGTMTLGSSSGANILNIANGAGATTVNVANVQTAGSYNVGAAMTTGTVTIGGTGLQTGTVSIAPGTGAQTVGIATGGTGVKTVNIGTGAVANVITIGTVTGAASLALKSGTGNIISNAGFTVDSTGRNYNTVQPAFEYYLSASDSNATGDGTSFTIGSGNVLTKVFDQGNNFTTGGTFTAPITGKYFFYLTVIATNVTSAAATTFQPIIATTSAGYNLAYQSGVTNKAAGNFLGGNGAIFVKMTAGDTCIFKLIGTGGSKVMGVDGGGEGLTQMGGYLVC